MEKIKPNPFSFQDERFNGNYIVFAGHSIKQREAVEYRDCQLDSKLTGEAMASKVLKNPKIPLSPEQVPDPCV